MGTKIVNNNYDIYQQQIFDSIENTIIEMSSYYGNILHCHLGFFEERGFYNNVIAVASNIELAYNRYANLICDAIVNDIDSDEPTTNAYCYVISDKSTSVCATDPFYIDIGCEEADNFLISINIPMPYIFKYEDVSYFIIHEISHFIGNRKRQIRATVFFLMLYL